MYQEVNYCQYQPKNVLFVTIYSENQHLYQMFPSISLEQKAQPPYTLYIEEDYVDETKLTFFHNEEQQEMQLYCDQVMLL